MVIFTNNSLRHKFFANTLAAVADSALVVAECKPMHAPTVELAGASDLMRKHFELRTETEQKFFSAHNAFHAPTMPIIHKEVNLPYVYKVVERFKPDIAFVFGSWIIKEPLLSLIPSGKFINLHLGVSPYYRGSGTNFWPFVNRELEYVGSTILHIDAGIDAGDIITHTRPVFEIGDNVHTVGCKVVQDSVRVLLRIISLVRTGDELARVSQWKDAIDRYYRKADFTDEILRKYYANMDHGLIEEYVRNPRSPKRLSTPL